MPEESLYRFEVSIKAVPLSMNSGSPIGETVHVNGAMTFPATLIAYTASVDALRKIIGKTTALQTSGGPTQQEADAIVASPASFYQ